MKAILVGMIAALGLLLLAPVVLSAVGASPTGSVYLSPSLTVIKAGGSDTIDIGTRVGTSCPFGYTWGGTVTITTPSGSVSTYSTPNNLEPCGFGFGVVYAADFNGTPGTPSPNTNQIGNYLVSFSGATRAGQPGVGMSWSLTDGFSVT
jgi:hypothetical protein